MIRSWKLKVYSRTKGLAIGFISDIQRILSADCDLRQNLEFESLALSMFGEHGMP
jgi:hypothetical protein